MTKLGFAFVAAVALTVMVAPSVFAANEFCVIQNRDGQLGVTNGTPAYGWSKIADSRCFGTLDGAVRDAGTGQSPPMISGGYTVFHQNPQAIPERPMERVYSEGLP